MVTKSRQCWIYISEIEVWFLYKSKKSWNSKVRFGYEGVSYKAGESGAEDKADLIGILRSFREKNFGKNRVPVYLIIPFQNGLFREVKLPWMNKRKREAAIRYYIRNEIPVLPDEFFYDYSLTEDIIKEFLHIRLTAARKDTISFYDQVLQQAGYCLQGIEYSLSAIGEMMDSDKTVIFLQGLKKDRLQFIIYKDGVPQTVREIELNQFDQAKYHIYLALKEFEVPLDLVLSDQSDAAEIISGLLVNSGFAKEHQNVLNFSPKYFNETDHQGFFGQVLWGERQRTIKRKNYNFYKILLRPIKVKIAACFTAGILGILMFFGGVVWYPAYQNYSQVGDAVQNLQKELQHVENNGDGLAWDGWKKEQELSSANLEKVRHALSFIGSGMNLTRMNYKQNTLFLWIDCRDNASVTSLIVNLTAAGWKEPLLLEYKYTTEKTSVCLSVRR
ncbi:MAG: hypothetical protein AWM53_00633 [Candidatus Dichloromethanomonas elyunquensis]|nr:MAG: hypothetical protein AWM53_00633 [Candidatus Dichloromethanomonas elyunquensis]